jgi:hypothetical protein
MTALNRLVLGRDEAAHAPLASHRIFSKTLDAAPRHAATDVGHDFC